MSKATTGGSPWCGWRWVHARLATAPRAADSRTAAPPAASLAAFLTALSLVACAPFGAERAYRHAQDGYRRGDLAQAAAESLGDAARWQSDRNSPWFWNFRLLAAEACTAQANYPRAETLLAEPVPALPQLSRQRARLLVDRANLNVSRFRDAGDLLRQARAAALDPELAARVNLVEGVQALNQRRHERAQELFRAALDIAERSGDPYYQASALNNLSISSKRLDRYEESVAYGQRALEAAARAGARRIEAQAHTNLGPSFAYLGEFDDALRHEREAIEMLRAMGMRGALTTALGELGLIYDRADQPSKAIPCYREAYDMALAFPSERDAARFAENLALALIKTQQWPEASQWNRRAAELAAKVGARENLPYLERNRARIAAGMGDIAEAERICHELLRNPSLPAEIGWAVYTQIGDMNAARKRFREANRNYDHALRAIDRSRSSLADSHFKITLLSYLIPFYQHYVEALVRQNDDAGALRVVESSRARVLAERMGRDFRSERFPSAAALEGVARAVDASVLSFWVAPQRSFAWLIQPDRIRRFELPPAAEIEALVTAYRRVVEHSVEDPLAGTAGANLWNRLMGGIAAALPPGSRLIVIPDGPLHRLNLETLPVPGSPPGRPHYWIEDVSLAVAPSITIASSTTAARAATRGLLLIADPEYRGTGYEPLPGAADELRQVLANFPGAAPAIYTGGQATPAAYRQAEPGRFAVIHFAAHAEANLEQPLESAVVLAGQQDSCKLYARDVIGIPLQADLVTLSACRSAGAREYAGEGLLGFAWAFLEAGARAVVAGLWDVSDRSSPPLMARFYAALARRRDPVSALREAKLALLHGQPAFRRPFYWAPWQVYIGGARK